MNSVLHPIQKKRPMRNQSEFARAHNAVEKHRSVQELCDAPGKNRTCARGLGKRVRKPQWASKQPQSSLKGAAKSDLARC